MEDAIIPEYYEIIAERMKADNLLGKNRAPLFWSEDDFYRYCKPIIRNYEMKTLRTEVMTLETFTIAKDAQVIISTCASFLTHSVFFLLFQQVGSSHFHPISF